MQLKSARSSSTSSAAMSTRMSTRPPSSLWTTPRCSSPMLAWTRYTTHTFPHHSTSLHGVSIIPLHSFTFVVPLLFSTSQSSSTPSIPPTLWPSCVVPPTPRSVSAQEVNTTTWTMWVKMSTIIPSSRCWGPGLLGTTLRYYAVIPSYHHNGRFWRPIDQKICVTIYSLVSVLKCLAPLYL